MSLNIIAWNAHSLNSKYSELSYFIDDNDIDVLLINESWFRDDTSFSLPGFLSYRADRFHGGSCIFIKSNIPHFGFSKITTNFAEACTISISIDNQLVKLCSLYCSPSATRAQAKDFFGKVLSQPGQLIIAGDFNCKHNAWNNLNNDRKGQDLYDLLTHFNFSIIPPNEPTLYPYIGDPSCVDFVVCKGGNFIDDLEVINDLSSDHLPLKFSVRNVLINNLPPNHKRANWKKFKALMAWRSEDLASRSLSSPKDIDDTVEAISTTILNSLNDSSPLMSPITSRYKYSTHVALLIKNRNHFRNLFKRTCEPAYKSSVNQLNKLIRAKIREEKLSNFDSHLSRLSYKDNSLYHLAKSFKRKKKSVPPLIDPNGTYYTDKDKAEVFVNSFKQSFEISLNAPSKFESTVRKSVQSIPPLNLGEVSPIAQSEVESIFKSLNPKKACGPDSISNSALIALSSCNIFVNLCTNLFNACLNLAHFPNNWKIAKILPIPKTSTPSSNPDNYRPISLLSCLGKCFEKLVLGRLNEFELENNIFIDQQCGFRSNHSTVHQIMRIVENISFGFNMNKSTAMLLLDLRKAFDTVWHDGLVHKLIKYKYPNYLVKLIYSYLRNRSAFVTLHSASSSSFEVLSGVPQGSLLSPHLFNLFLNDIPLLSKGQLSLFADDTAYFIQVPWKSLKSAKKLLLHALSTLQSYFIDWKIFLNEKKTEFIMFSKSTKMLSISNQDSICYNNNNFKWKPSVKYLGVKLDSKLLFKEHINFAIQKAKAVAFSSLYCILNRKSPASIDTKARVFKSYIRPILTYACPIYANAAKSHLAKLQLFQNKLLRMILNKSWLDFSTTREIHDSLKMPFLSDFIEKITSKFYLKTASHSNSIFATLGNYNADSLDYVPKHRLPKAL